MRNTSFNSIVHMRPRILKKQIAYEPAFSFHYHDTTHPFIALSFYGLVLYVERFREWSYLIISIIVCITLGIKKYLFQKVLNKKEQLNYSVEYILVFLIRSLMWISNGIWINIVCLINNILFLKLLIFTVANRSMIWLYTLMFIIY